MRGKFIVTLLIITTVLCVCVQSASPADRLNVVTTLTVLKSIAESVGGDRVVVESLSSPEQDPHYVQPRPTLMKRTRNADVFIEVGLQLELWAQKVVDGSGNPKIQLGQPGRVIASDGIPTLELPRIVSREWGDIHPYGNPHVWLDPINAKTMAANMAAAFSLVDPQHAADYEERLRAFQRRIDVALFGEALVEQIGGPRLTRLAEQERLFQFLEDEDLRDRLGGWLKKAEALRGKQIVTFHKTWVYFGTRFGFTVPVEIEEKPGIPPSAKHRDHVIEIAKREDVKVLLGAIFYSRSVMDYISERTGARVVQVPIDSGEPVGAPSYFNLIDHVIDKICGALGG